MPLTIAKPVICTLQPTAKAWEAAVKIKLVLPLARSKKVTALTKSVLDSTPDLWTAFPEGHRLNGPKELQSLYPIIDLENPKLGDWPSNFESAALIAAFKAAAAIASGVAASIAASRAASAAANLAKTSAQGSAANAGGAENERLKTNRRMLHLSSVQKSVCNYQKIL